MTSTTVNNSDSSNNNHDTTDVQDDGSTSSSEHDDGAAMNNSSHRTDHPSSSNSEKSTTKMIGADESRFVDQWRTILVLVLLVTAAAICTGTFLFVRNESNKDYQLSFTLFANSMEAQMENHVENLQEGLRNLGDTITASSHDNDYDLQQDKDANVNTTLTFPFVTVGQFETHGEHARSRSKMETIAYAPLVTSSQKEAWEDFSVQNQQWIEASRAAFVDRLTPLAHRPVYLPGKISPHIYHREESGSVFTDPSETTAAGSDYYAPIWYLSPPPFNPATVNFDVLSDPEYQVILQQAIATQGAVFSKVTNVEPFSSLQVSDADHVLYHEQFNVNFTTSTSRGDAGTIGYHLPHSLYAQPVFRTRRRQQVAGILWGPIAWDAHLSDLLPAGVRGVYVVLQSTCPGQEVDSYYTYELNGGEPAYLGPGDLHDKAYDSMRRIIPFQSSSSTTRATSSSSATASPAADSSGAVCQYILNVYPSKIFEESYHSNITIIATVTVAGTFVIVALIFVIYDALVRARNKKITQVANRTNAVVNSLFPETVRERLMQENGGGGANNWGASAMKMDKQSLQPGGGASKPIADLFPEATIMFADIVGFTAWSSMREPSQVFVLLESLYAEFDDLARRRRVFKVETIGDCYVASCGCPKLNKDHALVMARFAKDCISVFGRKVKELEVVLGPDTGDLAVRVGLHSGPVTAGVLRGDRARFQLFGDTMNVASRIESSGARNRVHCSQETADLLVEAGKGSWVIPREDKVHAKGKGDLQTYWIKASNGREAVSSNGSSSIGDKLEDTENKKELEPGAASEHPKITGKLARLVEWNCDVLSRHLKQIIARRMAANNKLRASGADYHDKLVLKPKEGQTMLDEVAEIIELPAFDSKVDTKQDHESIELSPQVKRQLKDLVERICSMYGDNHFHCFEHASHVSMSITKLLSRIVAPSVSFHENQTKHVDASSMHDHTYGITSDPLTQFTVVFSGLIHDLDHPGVPNSQLVKEGTSIAKKYQGMSVAEQNSVDLAWDLLMEDRYRDLRACIYSNESELTRFRQLTVNVVLATDIVDKQLKALRNARWEKAFSGEHVDEDPQKVVNRKATIVIEHLIQASDVAHTMQHWHIYRKWNERFFLECYKAFKEGRAEKDPAEYWFQGEIGFFDFYIIPLAKKLKDCGVFGVSSDEYLNYATKNREEWLARGETVVSEMIQKAKDLYG